MTKKLAEDFLYPFTPGQMTMLHTLALRMREFGLTADDVHTIVVEAVHKPKLLQKKELRPPVEPALCPDCGAMIDKRLVNVSRCTQVGGGYTHIVVCRNDDCAYTQLTREMK